METKENKPPTYGRKIPLTKVNKLIVEFNQLDGIIEKSVKEAEQDNAKKDRAKEMISGSYNAFIFDKELIDRFFHASSGQDENLYLMVLLGAHDEKETIGEHEFKAGSFTVIAVGCNMKKTIRDGKEVELFFPAKTSDPPGTEYPPRKVVAEVPEEPLEGGTHPSLIFQVID